MFDSLTLFKSNIEDARNLTSLYEYLESTVIAPLSFEDLLRSQIVYSVSAFDKLIHDVICTGMVDIFAGRRNSTSKYESEPLSISIYNEINAATIPPKEYVFEQAIRRKLKKNSYQDPSNVAEGLSYIWEEKHKWQKIAATMSMSDKESKTRLRLIVDRRNIIVHEADIDPETKNKIPINQDDARSTSDFIYKCGENIVNLLT